MNLRPFHLAFTVHDLEESRAFYAGTMGCGTGRESKTWIDFDFFGHQIVAHHDVNSTAYDPLVNPVDGDNVPVPHFGIVLTPDQWDDLRIRFEADEKTHWVIEPKIRFKGEPGEQRTMFVLDPSGNALEFKAFGDDSSLFAK